MSVTDEIKNRLDIVDILSDYMPLRKSGSTYSGFCPFHPNSRTPAFSVFPNTQTWHCFGACSEGGDIFTFVMKKEGWEFREALVHLAERAGVELEQHPRRSKEQKAYEDKLTGILDSATDYFHQILLYAPQAEHVRRYLADRSLREETISSFRLGFALDSWDACKDHFNMQGYSDDDLVDAGLLTINEEKGSKYDRFRNRLMIPIADHNGLVVGFGARTLDPDGIPKYLNSPQTPIFDKGRMLYGLDRAKRHIREARQVIIVEGYMDVIQAWQGGFKNVVAQMGTALTANQLSLLKRYTKRFVLALDSDAAGMQATMRGLEVAREALDREDDVRFDARGLVRHEGRLQADIRIVSLPRDYDPDKLIKEDASRWQELISSAKPVVSYVIDLVTDGLDMGDAKEKAAAVRRVLPLIDDIADPVERDHYRQHLARKLQVDERSLTKISRVSNRPRSAAARTPSEPVEGVVGSGAGRVGMSLVVDGTTIAAEPLRENYLRQCLVHPSIIPVVDRMLALNDQPVVERSDFQKPDDQALWLFIRRQSATWTVASEGDLWDSLDDEFLRDRVQTLLAVPVEPVVGTERLPDLLTLSVLDWRLEGVKTMIGEVQQLYGDQHLAADKERKAIIDEKLRELSSQFRRINKARASMTATGRRRTKEALGGATVWRSSVNPEDEEDDGI